MVEKISSPTVLPKIIKLIIKPAGNKRKKRNDEKYNSFIPRHRAPSFFKSPSKRSDIGAQGKRMKSAFFHETASESLRIGRVRYERRTFKTVSREGCFCKLTTCIANPLLLTAIEDFYTTKRELAF